MAKIIYLSVKPEIPATDYWDHTFLQETLDKCDVQNSDRDVVIIPGAYQWDVTDQINTELAKSKKVLVFITSDEEGKFDVSKLKHPDMIVYSEYGNGGLMFPLGYSPKTREIIKSLGLQDKYSWFFAGQVTHERRRQMVEQLDKMPGAEDNLLSTHGFSQGYTKEQYLTGLNKSKVALAPPGPISQDSFRLYESLEAGCVPIVDDISPMKSVPDNYWKTMFGEVPFPIVRSYENLPKLINFCLADPDLNNKVMAWWIGMKYQLKTNLKFKLGTYKDDMAVVIPVSPIPSHPSTKILEETIRTIRVHTNAPILLSIDGVRKEQEGMRYNYREFTRQILWKCNFEFEDVIPIIFNKHSHQSGMMKSILDSIDLPIILYVEQDCPLTPDRIIEWDKLKNKIKSGEANLIRFHFESFIPEPHKYLMIGDPEDGLLKTRQWSQRPHMASTKYYKFVMDNYFSPESNTFIEDRMHSVLQVETWNKHKVFIYHPEGEIKRSYHLDGREGAEKYDKNLIY